MTIDTFIKKWPPIQKSEASPHLVARARQDLEYASWVEQEVADLKSLIASECELSHGCLQMIEEELLRHPCACGPHKKGEIAPMMYPEWIRSVVAKVASKCEERQVGDHR